MCLCGHSMVPCWNKYISATELFQCNRTCRKLCQCHLPSARDNQLAPPIPWKNSVFISRYGTTCWNKLFHCKTILHRNKEIIILNNFISRWTDISTWKHNFTKIKVHHLPYMNTLFVFSAIIADIFIQLLLAWVTVPFCKKMQTTTSSILSTDSQMLCILISKSLVTDKICRLVL